MSPSQDPQVLAAAVLQGDRRALARLITHVENHPDTAGAALRMLFPATGSAYVAGLTGAPGAGKSTLTDQLVTATRAAGGEVAVLAVDPSSPFTGGAILGDRIRMQNHAGDPGVYVRSMASRGALGGISAATPRAVAVLDAAGFPTIIVETVGVGQAEVEIVGAADTTIVVVNPGWGDAIQASKAGLLEIGDVFVVNKADRPGAEDTVRDLRQMLELGRHLDWEPPIVSTVATRGDGVDELVTAIDRHQMYQQDSGTLQKRRRRRLEAELAAAVQLSLQQRFQRTIGDAWYTEAVADVIARRIDPWSAAERLTAALG
ncbi:MAG: methylmalonyl Co-A mutase-associated GTPase MeaB [Acidimicrobiia bacterium]